jgi:RNA polymerase sigma-70 factor, ECF subfamily
MAATAALSLDDPTRAEKPPELGEDVLSACAHGDPAALRRFVVRYQPMVFAFLSRALGHGPHVEDLAQEALLRAVRALPRYDVRGPAKPSTWLLTIVAHLVADVRKRKVETLHAGDEPDVTDPRTPEGERHSAEIATALCRAAALLPADQRDAFILAEMHDLTMDEIAQVVCVPVGTVKARLYRARERLRELLGDLWEEER